MTDQLSSGIAFSRHASRAGALGTCCHRDLGSAITARVSFRWDRALRSPRYDGARTLLAVQLLNQGGSKPYPLAGILKRAA